MLTYAPSYRGMWTRSAAYVDRLLKALWVTRRRFGGRVAVTASPTNHPWHYDRFILEVRELVHFFIGLAVRPMHLEGCGTIG